MFAPLNTLAYTTLNPVHRTEATIVNTMARSLGSSMGISMLQATVVRDAAIAHARLTEHIAAGSPMLASALPAHMDPSSALGAQLLNGLVTRQATMLSYNTVFAWMALLTTLMIPLLLTMRAARGAAPQGARRNARETSAIAESGRRFRRPSRSKIKHLEPFSTLQMFI